MRVFGRGVGAPKVNGPQYVDCNGVHVAVSEAGVNRVCVLSYADGLLVGRVARAGAKAHFDPFGIKLLADGSGVVVADRDNHRAVLLSLATPAEFELLVWVLLVLPQCASHLTSTSGHGFYGHSAWCSTELTTKDGSSHRVCTTAAVSVCPLTPFHNASSPARCTLAPEQYYIQK